MRKKTIQVVIKYPCDVKTNQDFLNRTPKAEQSVQAALVMTVYPIETLFPSVRYMTPKG